MKTPMLNPTSQAICPRDGRRSLIALLVLGVFLSGCAGLGSAKYTDDLFIQYDFAIGSAQHQTVLTGFLLDGPMADLAVLNIEENGERRLKIYSYENSSWGPSIDTKLRREDLFVDVVRIGNKDRLITYEPGRLNWFDPDSVMERPLVNLTTNYNPLEENEIAHVDITQDLNHDGRDDIVLPDFDGFWIATQLGDGSFAEAVKLGPPEPFLNKSAMGEKPSYREVGINAMTIRWYLSRLHELDYNQDSRSDLVFWNDDHFDVYYQDARGQFATVADTFTTDVAFDSGGAYSLAFAFSGENVIALIYGFRKKSTHTVLHSFQDLNGDKIPDLVTLTLAGRGLGNQRSVYKVHHGVSSADGIQFAQDVRATIKPPGRAGALLPWGYSSQSFQDLDGDGHVDLTFQDVKTSLGGMINALAGKTVPVDLAFYCSGDEDFPEKPTTRRKYRRFNPFEKKGNVFFPPVLVGDVNGDGLADLLIGQNTKELRVYLGGPESNLFARKPQKVKVTLPYNELNTRLADLNQDGKKDILIHHRSNSEVNRVTILVAK